MGGDLVEKWGASPILSTIKINLKNNIEVKDTFQAVQEFGLISMTINVILWEV